jgi:hypothetical protein
MSLIIDFTKKIISVRVRGTKEPRPLEELLFSFEKELKVKEDSRSNLLMTLWLLII